jgi:hypothetical protein
VGEWNTNSDIDCGEEFCGMPVQDIPLSYVIVHPSYDKQTYRNNIALLVLKDRINYTGQYEGAKPETHTPIWLWESSIYHASQHKLIDCYFTSYRPTDMPAGNMVGHQHRWDFGGLGQERQTELSLDLPTDALFAHHGSGVVPQRLREDATHHGQPVVCRGRDRERRLCRVWGGAADGSTRGHPLSGENKY